MGMGEAARLAAHGVTEGELMQTVTTLINYFGTQAVMKDSLESSTWMRRVMEAVNNGDQLMAADVKHLILQELAGGLSVEVVSARAAELFKPFLDLGEKGGGGGELREGALFPIAKAFVCKPDALPEPAEGEVVVNGDMAMPGYSKSVFFDVLKESIQNPDPPEVLDVPQNLVEDATIEELVGKLKPSVVAREETPIGPDEGKLKKLVLSNGVRIFHRHNTARPKEFRVRVSAVGGRAVETKESQGRAIAGAALLVNGGAGQYPAEVLSRWASMNQLSYDCSCGSESFTFDMVVHTTVDGAIDRAMRVLWLYLAHPLLDSRALDRFKVRVARSQQSLSKSVERTTTLELVKALFNEESQWRIAELPSEAVNKIELADVKTLLQQQLVPSNLEVSISGDYDEALLEEALVRYVGILGGQEEGGRGEPLWKGREEEVFKLSFGRGSNSGTAAHIDDDTGASSQKFSCYEAYYVD